MENNKLFTEFPPVSTEKWEEVINKDLKGADYEKKLVWKTIEGFKVKPYYRAEDLEHLEYMESNPGEFPYTRGKRTDNNVWDIRQDMKTDNIEATNKMALDAVNRGANSLGLCAMQINTVEQMKQLLSGLNLEEVKVNFTFSRRMLDTMKIFAQVVSDNGFDPLKVEGSFNWDMYAYALIFGQFEGGEEACYNEAMEMIAYAEKELPKMKVLAINGRHLHNAGSNIVQELGFTLAAANDLLAHLTDRGLSVDQVAPQMVFNFATGSNYFMEIAKIRAARMLWSKIVEQYHPGCDCCHKVFISATSSTWNKSVFDPYVNMLRTTTETMSAAIAGADSITTNPFDIAYKECDDFGYRIGRNQQILLKEESYMDKIVDPAAGSYYIENLTDSIAQHAWSLFLEAEARGGYAQALREGFVQDQIEQVAQQRDMDIATRKTTILGTNQYPNLQERMSEKIEKHQSCPPPAGSDIKTLRQYRGAEAFEQLRLDTEKSGRRPKVFLLTYGNLAMRKARSGFATNFFGVAGYEILDNAGFSSAAEGVKAALESQAEVVVMCSSDDEYAEIAQEVCTGLKGKVKSIVLAGYPKEMVETYRGYGVDQFIHVKTNALQCLQEFNQMLLR